VIRRVMKGRWSWVGVGKTRRCWVVTDDVGGKGVVDMSALSAAHNFVRRVL
jgi:hypothetical protein